MYNNYSNEQNLDNFFLHNCSSININEIAKTNRRLNDYDYNILEEGAYKEVSDELLKLEYKIAYLENLKVSFEERIQAAKDINEYDTAEYLLIQKTELERSLQALMEIYNEKSISSRISGGCFNVLFPKLSKLRISLNDKLSVIRKFVLGILPQKLSTVQEMKQYLDKLKNINNSVNDLMMRDVPYGEGTVKYEQLSKYISKANNLHSKITKLVKNK